MPFLASISGPGQALPRQSTTTAAFRVARSTVAIVYLLSVAGASLIADNWFHQLESNINAKRKNAFLYFNSINFNKLNKLPLTMMFPSLTHVYIC
jgi:hypothetical protein